jgi:hypothetical protein
MNYNNFNESFNKKNNKTNKKQTIFWKEVMLKLEPEQLVYVILPVRLIDKSIISLSSMQTISKKYYDETLNIKKTNQKQKSLLLKS